MALTGTRVCRCPPISPAIIIIMKCQTHSMYIHTESLYEIQLRRKTTLNRIQHHLKQSNKDSMHKFTSRGLCILKFRGCVVVFRHDSATKNHHQQQHWSWKNLLLKRPKNDINTLQPKRPFFTVPSISYPIRSFLHPLLPLFSCFYLQHKCVL